MQGIMYDLKMSKVMLLKMHLAGKNGMLKYRRDWTVPKIRHSKEVLAKTLLGGICATDLHMASLDISMFASIIANPQNPFPMGHELVAQVHSVGPDVKDLNKGDRVVYLPSPSCEIFGFQPCTSCRNGDYQSCLCLAGMGDGSELEERYRSEGGFGGVGGGGYCEYLKGFEKQFFLVPENIPDEAAVLTEPFAVGLHAVIRNLPEGGQDVMVIGAGIIGLMVVAALRSLYPGCRIITLARYPFQAEAAGSLGSDEVIMESDKEKLYKTVAQLTGGRLFKPFMGPRGVFGEEGPDVIFDTAATERTLDDSLHLVRSGGKIVIVGQGYAKTKKVDWSIQNYKEVDTIGSLMYGMEPYQGRKVHCFQLALGFLRKNPEKFAGLLTHTYSIDRYRDALGAVRNKRKSRVIKAAFDFR